MMFGAEHPILTACRIARAAAAWSMPGAQLAQADEILSRMAVALERGDDAQALSELRSAAVHVPTLAPIATAWGLSMRMELK